MWRKLKKSVTFILLALGIACRERSTQQATATPEVMSQSAGETPWMDSLRLIHLGDSLTTARQQALLQRLLQAYEKEGWGGAVRYCHLAAETLAFYTGGGLHIQRIAERYRNPKDKIQDSLDQAAWSYFQQTGSKASIVWQNGSEWRYYRPIYIVMPTCLKCHGAKEDIDALALTEIRKHYPLDKATGFRIGDLRGLWRLTYSVTAHP